ncbi:MAG: hypothetical protein Ct9H90mP30_6030 [Actinomycetota bacterium]|nr:MAG: hypothetical protein Ct9H90mP30_6030 [Actinomycetota bacterium]
MTLGVTLNNFLTTFTFVLNKHPTQPLELTYLYEGCQAQPHSQKPPNNEPQSRPLDNMTLPIVPSGTPLRLIAAFTISFFLQIVWESIVFWHVHLWLSSEDYTIFVFNEHIKAILITGKMDLLWEDGRVSGSI